MARQQTIADHGGGSLAEDSWGIHLRRALVNDHFATYTVRGSTRMAETPKKRAPYPRPERPNMATKLEQA